MFAWLQICCLLVFWSMGKGFVTASRRRLQEDIKQSPYQNEPSYGEQSWIFEAINLLDVWDMGYTGKGVRVRINDDSWEYNHAEWDFDRLIDGNSNAEDDYACDAPNNTLTRNDVLAEGIAKSTLYITMEPST